MFGARLAVIERGRVAVESQDVLGATECSVKTIVAQGRMRKQAGNPLEIAGVETFRVGVNERSDCVVIRHHAFLAHLAPLSFQPS